MRQTVEASSDCVRRNVHFIRQFYDSLSAFRRPMKMAKSQPSPRSLRAVRAMRLPGALLVALIIAGLLLIPAARPRIVRGSTPEAYAIKDAQIITGTGKTIAK